MKISRKVPIALFAVALTLGLSGLFLTLPRAHAAQSTVNLQTATQFAILAGTPGITDVANSSTIIGSVGLAPATGAGIGLLCPQVSGNIYSVDAAGPLPCRLTNGPLMVTAKNDLTAAYIDAAGRTPVTTLGTELGGTTVTAGVYASDATTFQITAGAGPLVINGQGDPSSVFIFEMGFNGTGLTVGPGSTVSLINGASPCNIFWRVDTASIDTTAVFKGNVLALTSITVNNGANIVGRLLARNGTVTLNNDTISAAVCGATTTSSTGSTGVVPKLPNTGATSANHTIVWAMDSAGIALIAAFAIYSVRKKKTN